MTRRRRPRPITITTSEVIEDQIRGHARGLGATVVAPLSRLLRLAKTGSGQASQAHREFVRAAEFEERPLRGANLRSGVDPTYCSTPRCVPGDPRKDSNSASRVHPHKKLVRVHSCPDIALDLRNPLTSRTFHWYAGWASPAAADRSWRTRSVDCADPRGHLYLP